MKLLKTIASATEFCTGGCTGLLPPYLPIKTQMCDSIFSLSDLIFPDSTFSPTD